MSSTIERIMENESASHVVLADDRSIGKILLDAGKIDARQAEQALRMHKERGVRFGEACIKLGYVTRTDIERALARQYDYPYIQPGDTGLARELVAAYDPFSAKVEELRALRTQLLLRWFNQERKRLAIVSPGRGDGRSYVAANLAIVFSQLGERTLLIDADMRRPKQHALFGLDNQYGLSSLLAGRVGGKAIRKVGHFADLSVMPAGANPPNPLELVSRAEFRELVADESRNYDVILIDTPAARDASDAQAIASVAGGALMIVRRDRSRVAALERLADAIANAPCTVVGSVLNRA